MSYSTEQLQEIRNKYVARGVSNGNLNIAKTAKNSTIVTEKGEEFIDFAGAIGVMNVGHSHPKVVAAIKATFWCTIFHYVDFCIRERQIFL